MLEERLPFCGVKGLLVATLRQQRASRRRQRRVRAAANDLSDLQWQQLRRQWGGCAYCGDSSSAQALQKDCVLAISRGGAYTWRNVVPACRSCNASKCNSEVTSWMRRKRLSEPDFLERWAQNLKRMESECERDPQL